MPRVSVNVGYFRNWWGNWYVVDNRATSLADYTPFSIVAPIDPRLPNGGGNTVGGLYNLVPGQGRPGRRARAGVRATSAKQTENWQGVDLNVVARLRMGLTVQGGHEHRAPARGRLRVRAKLPEPEQGHGRHEQLGHSELTALGGGGAASV